MNTIKIKSTVRRMLNSQRDIWLPQAVEMLRVASSLSDDEPVGFGDKRISVVER
jgi:hypothetical protein